MVPTPGCGPHVEEPSKEMTAPAVLVVAQGIMIDNDPVCNYTYLVR